MSQKKRDEEAEIMREVRQMLGAFLIALGALIVLAVTVNFLSS